MRRLAPRERKENRQRSCRGEGLSAEERGAKDLRCAKKAITDGLRKGGIRLLEKSAVAEKKKEGALSRKISSKKGGGKKKKKKKTKEKEGKKPDNPKGGDFQRTAVQARGPASVGNIRA